jgi:hypothetical protein
MKPAEKRSTEITLKTTKKNILEKNKWIAEIRYDRKY